MRGRGGYCQIPLVVNGDNQMKTEPKVIKIIENDSDIEVIDIIDEKQISNKRSKCEQRSKQNNCHLNCDLILIESDEELKDEDEIQVLDINWMSSTNVKSIETEPICLTPIRKCGKCLRQLFNQKKEYKYNCLTSADFYANPRIHPSVISVDLKDRNRYNCFNESISRNKHLFQNKTVLIIGSGTGLLALMAAKAEPQTVIVFDRPGIQELIEGVIEKNRWKVKNMRKIKFFIKPIEEKAVLPNGINKVDIIVSEWVNHSLFFKSLIKFFINARNNWLKEGGLIYPDTANVYLAAAHDRIHKHISRDKRHSNSIFVRKIDYWDQNLYELDMTALRPQVLSEPFHEYVERRQLITNEYLIKSFDLNELSLEDLNFSSKFKFNATKDHYLESFVLFFEIVFSKTQTIPRMYSTRPSALKNIYRPTIYFMESDKQMIVNKNDKIKGHFDYMLSEDLNQMTVNIDFKLKNKYLDAKEKLVYTTN